LRACSLIALLFCAVVLQASAADNGQCLVHDVNSFGSNGVVNGLISHVAAASISSSDSGDAVRALAWHPAGMLLLGTEAGRVWCGVV
jgi:hypothetical protein